MKRRALLRAGAAAVGGGGAALAGVAVTSDDASAQTAMTLDVAGDSATVAPDASVTAVTLSLDVSWSYDLPETASPSTVVVEIAAGTDDLTVVDSAESAQLFAEASGDESFETELLDGGALDASALAPDSGSRDTAVTVEARLRVEDGEGGVLARETASDDATVTVERDSVAASEYGEIGGSGSLTIETGSE